MTPKQKMQKKDLKTQEDYNDYNTRGPGSNPCNPVNVQGAGEQSSQPPFKTFLCERLMIFIDGENLFQFARENKIKSDFKKLADFLSEAYRLIRVYYYTGIPTKKIWNKDKEEEKQFEKKLNKQLNFLDSLELKYNFEVIKKPLAISNGRILEKGVDVRIASDIIWHGLSNNYGAFVLLSGDKDLMDCLIRMKDNGKKVIVANFEGRISREVKKIADKYINLSENLNKIKKTK